MISSLFLLCWICLERCTPRQRRTDVRKLCKHPATLNNCFSCLKCTNVCFNKRLFFFVSAGGGSLFRCATGGGIATLYPFNIATTKTIKTISFNIINATCIPSIFVLKRFLVFYNIITIIIVI